MAVVLSKSLGSELGATVVVKTRPGSELDAFDAPVGMA